MKVTFDSIDSLRSFLYDDNAIQYKIYWKSKNFPLRKRYLRKKVFIWQVINLKTGQTVPVFYNEKVAGKITDYFYEDDK